MQSQKPHETLNIETKRWQASSELIVGMLMNTDGISFEQKMHIKEVWPLVKDDPLHVGRSLYVPGQGDDRLTVLSLQAID